MDIGQNVFLQWMITLVSKIVSGRKLRCFYCNNSWWQLNPQTNGFGFLCPLLNVWKSDAEIWCSQPRLPCQPSKNVMHLLRVLHSERHFKIYPLNCLGFVFLQVKERLAADVNATFSSLKLIMLKPIFESFKILIPKENRSFRWYKGSREQSLPKSSHSTI